MKGVTKVWSTQERMAKWIYKKFQYITSYLVVWRKLTQIDRILSLNNGKVSKNNCFVNIYRRHFSMTTNVQHGDYN